MHFKGKDFSSSQADLTSTFNSASNLVPLVPSIAKHKIEQNPVNDSKHYRDS